MIVQRYRNFFYLFKGIKTNLVDTCLDNISGSAALHDDLYATARHVDKFIAIMNYRDHGRDYNILGVGT